MKLIENELLVMVDVDNTLVFPVQGGQTADVVVKCAYDGSEQRRRIHRRHVKLLKDKKARGYFVVVWSAAGNRWADAVVRSLGLEQHVDLVMSKPIQYVDDLPVEQWMPYRIYLQP